MTLENIRELLRAHQGLKREVYLDLENSSFVPDEIVEAMTPYFNRKAFGNPTLTHKPGWEAYETIMECTEKIAGFVGCRAVEEINFTPGETEANNLALMGAAFARKTHGHKIVVSEIEPVNVLHVTDLLKNYGYSTVKVPVDAEGFVDLAKLEEAVDKDTVLVSLSGVNHEIGTVQPIKQAVELVKNKNSETLFHTDASDVYGLLPFNVKDVDVDLATLSSYKILGPRGIGALYVKEQVEIDKILEGQIGTQRLWPGVENTPLMVGFAKASELAFADFDRNVDRLRSLRDRLANGILKGVTEVKVNGPRDSKRSPNNVNISFLGCEGEALTIELSLKGIYVSSGSACSRRLLQPSHVLVAIGRKFDEAHGSLLMKVSRYHSEDDIDYVLTMMPDAVARLRGISGTMGGI